MGLCAGSGQRCVARSTAGVTHEYHCQGEYSELMSIESVLRPECDVLDAAMSADSVA
jgi:hypothetical protein